MGTKRDKYQVDNHLFILELVNSMSPHNNELYITMPCCSCSIVIISLPVQLPSSQAERTALKSHIAS